MKSVSTDTDIFMGVKIMSNFKLTAQQRTALLTDMRAKMKINPHVLPETFKVHLASKAEIIDAAEKLGINPSDYGSPAGERVAPKNSAPRPAVMKVEAVQAGRDWSVDAGLEEQADSILQQPYVDLRGSLVDMLSNHQDLQDKLNRKPADNVVAMHTTAQVVDVPDVTEHLEKLDAVTSIPANKLFRGLNVDWEMPVYNDSRAPTIDPNYVPDPKVAHFFLSVARRNVPLPMLFFGPAGTGKSSLPRYFAAQTGRSFWNITVSDDTTVDDFFGGFQVRGGTTYWSDGLLLKAVRQEFAVILIDEVSRARPDVLVALNGILQDREYIVPQTGESIAVAEGVLILLADNTNGRGDASGLYAGAKQMDSSLLSRCAVKLHFGYPAKAQESRVLRQRSNAPKAFCDKLVDFMAICRKAHERGEAPTLTVSLRESTNIALMVMDGLDPSDCVQMVIGNALESVDQETLTQLFSTHVNPKEWVALSKGEEWVEASDDVPVSETPADDTDDMPFN
jgi:MoxR-like ATPase